MKSWWRQQRGFVMFLLLFGLFRTAVADWNPVPTGSMRPTIVEGDVVLVNRLAYQLKLPLTDVVLAQWQGPERGDIVTFGSPADGTRLLKRVVGLPGDRVELQGGQLWINGQAQTLEEAELVEEPLPSGAHVPAWRAQEQLGARRHAVQGLPTVPALRDGSWTLGEGQYFMLGDNRDNSHDSRYFGPVPRALLIGRVQRLLVSGDPEAYYLPRLGRLLKPLS
ncbi:signal peptidase I [Inhella inkyongensis]|uniref:Signal peptidase I n=1 Tax=Inhella inkyongensis TaxID=392593 RepID=A0A840S182_9BURK|nr:signal peptidase I [Inhella inkyongensis]MBB5204877.1 signal peptidase I [Inhella inkyongensis]